MIIKDTKGEFKHSVIYKGFKYDFGTGGIHGCIKAGVYEATKDTSILSCDVTSLYPMIGIVNSFYPQHLGVNFCKIYDMIFQKRSIAKKNGNKAVNEGLKLALNGSYGKSNDKFSFLYDPMYTMRITVNGQLMLCMLSEKLQDAGFKMLMINTDGMEFIVPNDQKQLYYDICKQWEDSVKLSLEYAEYKKMIIRDVNNYMAVYTNDKLKYKGAFEIDKEIWKDNSFKIIQIALSDYFVKGIAVESTIKNHNNIYNFCGRHKTNRECYSEIRFVKSDNGIPQAAKEKQQKTTRYYISNSGASFFRIYTEGKSKGTEEAIDKGYRVTIFNNYIQKNIQEYDINYQYYIRECYKIINIIQDNNQLKLF
jgi:hypothetical protein